MRLLLTELALRTGDGAADIASVEPLATRRGIDPAAGDILVLPELIGAKTPRGTYEQALGRLARSLGVHIVGGSHLCERDGAPLNRGVVVDAHGDPIAEYQKANRYGSELTGGFRSGLGPAVFEVGGVRTMVAICADFWNLPMLDPSPDVVLVPAFSVTQRPTPHMARTRWRHFAVSKAYETTAFVGVSDWSPAVVHADGRSSGAAGLARSNPARVRDLFSPVGARQLAAFDLDFAETAVLRADRQRRGFLTRATHTGP